MICKIKKFNLVSGVINLSNNREKDFYFHELPYKGIEVPSFIEDLEENDMQILIKNHSRIYTRILNYESKNIEDTYNENDIIKIKGRYKKFKYLYVDKKIELVCDDLINGIECRFPFNMRPRKKYVLSDRIKRRILKEVEKYKNNIKILKESNLNKIERKASAVNLNGFGIINRYQMKK